MTEYFVKLKVDESINTTALFVGPFSKEQLATDEIDRVRAYGNVEILTDGEAPRNPKNAIRTEIYTKVAARKEGLRSPNLGDKNENTLIGTKIPDNIDDLKAYYSKGYGLLPPDQKQGRGRPPKKQDETKPQPQPQPQAQTQPRTQEVSMRELTPSADTWSLEEGLPQPGEPEKYLIVAKYPGASDWLEQQGIVGKVVQWVNHNEKLDGMVVIGALPDRMRHLAKRVGFIDLPGLRNDQKGKPLTPEEMDAAGANIRWFVTKEITKEVAQRMRPNK
jgi:putative CRISPR-associated protein (TIGR02620 family)